MAYLLDTSLLARLANSADVQNFGAVKAVLELHRRAFERHIGLGLPQEGVAGHRGPSIRGAGHSAAIPARTAARVTLW